MPRVDDPELLPGISLNFLGILRHFSFLGGNSSYMNEDRPALSVTELLRTESTFQRCIDYIDIAGLFFTR